MLVYKASAVYQIGMFVGSGDSSTALKTWDPHCATQGGECWMPVKKRTGNCFLRWGGCIPLTCSWTGVAPEKDLANESIRCTDVTLLEVVFTHLFMSSQVPTALFRTLR